MAPAHSCHFRRLPGEEDGIGAQDDLSDSQAFAILRQRFPQAALCERVAAVARWRTRG